MSDDLVKRLRDGVGMQVGAWPVMIHEAADRIEALEAEVGLLEDFATALLQADPNGVAAMICDHPKIQELAERASITGQSDE